MKSIIVFGAGRFGASIATTLTNLGNEVLIVDWEQEAIDRISEEVTTAIVADVVDESITNQLGLKNFDIAVIAIGSNIEASIFATLACKENNIPEIYAKCNSRRHAEILKKLGADKIVFPENDIGLRVAHLIHSDKILDQLKLSDDFSVLEIKCLKQWIGKSLTDMNFRKKYNCNAIALKRENEVISPIDPDLCFQNEDIILVIGQNSFLDNIKEES